MRRLLMLLLLCSVACWNFVSKAENANQVLITVELAKKAGSITAPVSVRFPPDCKLCVSVQDPAYARQNSKVVILAMRVSRSKRIPVVVNTSRQDIRRILLEGVDLPFTTDSSDMLHFNLPPEPVDRINSGEFQTHIMWPGIDLRFEHGDPARRAGDYATGPWPAVQLKAAHNLEFAQLAAVRMLGLDSYVSDRNIGTIDLMGFDTNYPHGHTDYPPHMHMILWWPTVTGAGSLIGHYDLNPKGLLIHNEVIPLRVIGLKANTIPAGVPFVNTDDAGRPVWIHTITHQGWLRVARPGGSSCMIQPLDEGFDSGAVINCDGFPSRTVQVSDDLSHGVIRVITNHTHVHLYTYDTDSGRLLTSQ